MKSHDNLIAQWDWAPAKWGKEGEGQGQQAEGGGGGQVGSRKEAHDMESCILARAWSSMMDTAYTLPD